MKKIFLNSIFLFAVICANCQLRRPGLSEVSKENLREIYFNEFIGFRDTYKCATGDPKTNHFVDARALDSSFRPIFGTVILNNDELVTNGTAASLTQDKDKAVLSFNYSILNKSLKNAFNFGLYGSSSGALFNFYSDKSWQKGVGLNLGWSRISSSNNRSFSRETCEKLIEKRNIFISAKLGAIYEIIGTDIAALEDDSITIHTRLDFANKQKEQDIIPSEKSYKDDLAEYNKICEKLRLYDSLISTIDPIKFIHHLVKGEIVSFDKTNAEFTGYNVKWFSLNGTVGFSNNKIYNDTLKTNDSLLNFFNKDFLRAKITASWNIASYQKNILWFLTLSANIFNTNFLENRSISDIPILRYDKDLKKIVIQDNENKNLGSLKEFKNTVWGINPGIYYSAFFGDKKRFGFEFNGNYTAYINKPKDVKMPNIFNTTLGPLLRLTLKNAMPKATIGLIVGLFNAEEDTKVWRNSFGAQLKVGVPFNVLFSKKDKE